MIYQTPSQTELNPACPNLRASVAAYKRDVASFNRQESALTLPSIVVVLSMTSQ
ncbi:MAG: hypothetical protein WCL29_02910 [Pseudomonadota bacterium]